MKKHPWQLKLLSAVFAGIALGFPLQILWLFGDSSLEMIYYRLTSLNLLCMGLSIVSAGVLFRAHRASIVIVPLTLLAIAFNNLAVGLTGLFFSPYVCAISVISIFSLTAICMDIDVLRVLYRPQLRWWRIAPRIRINVPINLSAGTSTARCQIVDISESGVLAQIPEQSSLHVTKGQKLEVCFSLNAAIEFRFMARVARLDGQNVGLQFVSIPLPHLILLRSSIEALSMEAA